MEFPPELENQNAFVNALNNAVNDATQLPEILLQLIAAIEDEDFSKIANKGKDLFGAIRSLIENVKGLSDELKSLGGSLPGISAPDLHAFADDLPKRIMDYLIVKALETTPGLTEAF